MRGDSMDHLDPASRRRLQNRLNQRASRRETKQNRGNRWIIYTNDANASPDTEDRTTKTPEPSPTPVVLPRSQDQMSVFACGPSRLSPSQLFDQLKKQLLDAAGKIPPCPSLIHSVTQFNIIRAMCDNAAIMELTMDVLCEDIASIFNIAGPITFNLPPSLQPSSTQKQAIHHPWIDLLPVRSFRDVLIGRMAEYDDEELCGDLYGLSKTSGNVGLLVWGEAWDPLAYELSEEVARKWSWILKDSPELLTSTNYWRRKRGEKRLRFFDSQEHYIHEIE
ncbi:hypothetical protein PEBR_24643 [Penicillium brasilianum]|uniref:BZIP domain-containing protein n=1 Tax=Penicillium brasilianum TaxID=104259 RepID=A0A1S9RIZ0_PENBI|nr:hypothetical protein PEBR_24643 [Penicillium brasilianum]